MYMGATQKFTGMSGFRTLAVGLGQTKKAVTGLTERHRRTFD